MPKAQALGLQIPITAPTTLADLYNHEEPTFRSESTGARIGFSRLS